jgi:long-chain acyl-CoA synthetase
MNLAVTAPKAAADLSARPWIAHYGPTVRPTIDSAPFASLAELVRKTCATYADKIAFTACLPNGMNGSLTFRQIDEMSDAFAVYLRDVCGLKAGARVALQVPNGLSFPLVAFGVFKAGCVLVNVNPLYTAEEMGKQFRDAEPDALVVVDIFGSSLPAAMAIHSVKNVIVTRVAEFLPALPKAIVGLVQKYWDKSIKPIPVPHVSLLDALAQGRAARDAKQVDVPAYSAGIGLSDVAVLQYTGGTTGVSKGAMLSHGNLIMNTAQVMELNVGVEAGKETVLTALPLYHIFAFNVNLLGFFYLGARNILIPSPRPLSNLKRAFENYRITWMSGVNTLFNGLLNEQWFKDTPPKSLKFSSAGGMALHRSVAERWEAMVGSPIVEGYGLTESSPVITFNPLGKSRPDTIGVPVPSTDVRLVHDDGTDVKPGEAGELIARGPQIMLGYWRRPDETAKTIKDGWLYTGDVAVMDPDGYFRIVDRKKDMVLVSGFNVYPNEIEDCLAKLPGILEAAVIGVPDGAAGEAVKAFVVRKDKGLTPDQVRAHCKDHLTGYKVPKFVEFREELPKSNVGKILRKDLRVIEAAKKAS